MANSTRKIASDLPTQETLRALLDYDPETGHLTWRPRGPEWFEPTRQNTADEQARSWNTRHAGKPALSARRPNGYLKGALFNKTVRTHRIIWKWMTGEEPLFIDHINGQRADNRWTNLRSVTKLENCKNAAISRRNTSGVRGVYFRNDTQKWSASIVVEGKSIALGCFDCLTEARQVRQAAQKKYGFHENHGRPQ